MIDYISCARCKENHCDLCMYNTTTIPTSELNQNINYVLVPWWVLKRLKE